jgi:hypothetical protein
MYFLHSPVFLTLDVLRLSILGVQFFLGTTGGAAQLLEPFATLLSPLTQILELSWLMVGPHIFGVGKLIALVFWAIKIVFDNLEVRLDTFDVETAEASWSLHWYEQVLIAICRRKFQMSNRQEPFGDFDTRSISHTSSRSLANILGCEI